MEEESVCSHSVTSDASDLEEDCDETQCVKGRKARQDAKLIPLLRVVYNWLCINYVFIFPGSSDPCPLVESDEAFTVWMLGIVRSVWPEEGKDFGADDIRNLCMHTHEKSEGADAISQFLRHHYATSKDLESLTYLKSMYNPGGVRENPFSVLGLIVSKTVGTNGKHGAYVMTCDGSDLSMKLVSFSAFKALSPCQLFAPPKTHPDTVLMGMLRFIGKPGPFASNLKKPVFVWQRKSCEKSVTKVRRGLSREAEPDGVYDSESESGDESGDDSSEESTKKRVPSESLDVCDGDECDAVGGKGKKMKRRKCAPSSRVVKISGILRDGGAAHGKAPRSFVARGVNRRAANFLKKLPPSARSPNPSFEQVRVLAGQCLTFLRTCPRESFTDFLNEHNLSDVLGERIRAEKIANFLGGDMSTLQDPRCLTVVVGVQTNERLKLILDLFQANLERSQRRGVAFIEETFPVVGSTGVFEFPKPFAALQRQTKFKGVVSSNMLQGVLRVLRDPLLMWILMSRVKKPREEGLRIVPQTFARRLVDALRDLHETWRVYLRFGKIYTENGTYFDPVSRTFIPPETDTIFQEIAPSELKRVLADGIKQNVDSGMPLGCARYLAFEAVKVHPLYRSYVEERNRNQAIFLWNERDFDTDPGPILDGCPAAIKEAQRTRAPTIMAAIMVKIEKRPDGGKVIGSVDLCQEDLCVPTAPVAASSCAEPGVVPVGSESVAVSGKKKPRAPRVHPAKAITSLFDLLGGKK